jgi:hypothetical protein
MTFIRMERPAEYAAKKTLNDQELQEYFKKYRPNEDACGTGSRDGEVCSPEEDAQVGDYNEFWDNRKWVPDNRSSLIVDPENGRRPPYTPEFQKELTTWQTARRARGPLDSWEDFSTVTRCIAEQTPNGPQMYNSGTLIMQSPGWVMLIRERLDTRFIPLDGRPHVDENIRLWHGSSVGRWEGNTLVVDVTNHTDRTWFDVVGTFHSDALHVVERFTLVDSATIHYEATITDPKVFTRPWKIAFPLVRNMQPGFERLEMACHEGERSFGLMLRGQ